MARNGQIYIDLTEYGFDNLDLGCYKSQDDNVNFKGEEQDSAYGTMQIYNIAAKKVKKLQSSLMDYEKYKSIENFIISSLGIPMQIYIDSEGGNLIAKIRITNAARELAANGTNDKYTITLEITQV